MIDFKTFDRAIQYLQTCSDLRETLWGFNQEYPDIFPEYPELGERGETIIIEILENAFDSGDLITWWIYDCECGNSFTIGDLWYLDEKGENVSPDLSTTEQFYDYLVRQKGERDNVR